MKTDNYVLRQNHNASTWSWLSDLTFRLPINGVSEFESAGEAVTAAVEAGLEITTAA